MALRVRSVKFEESLKNDAPSARVNVELEQGSASRFLVATVACPSLWLEKSDFAFSTPVLFVRRLKRHDIEEAIAAMASEMSGYWLKYYNTPAGPELSQGQLLLKIPAKSRVATVDLVDLDAPARAQTGVVEIRLKDSRLFSILTSTASEFSEVFEQMGLKFYFGSQIMFLREISEPCAIAAADAMAKSGDRWLCIYDTPRTALPRILSDFKAKHA